MLPVPPVNEAKRSVVPPWPISIGRALKTRITGWGHSQPSPHVTALPPVHRPAWQVSFCVQAWPSSHEVPSAAGGLEHAPVAGSQVPAAWHWSWAVHVTPVQSGTPAQTPPVQTSLLVSVSPSLHAVPSATGRLEHWPVA